jgi:hypothetical protein
MPKDGPMKPSFWLEQGALKGPNYRLGEVARRAARTKLGVLYNRMKHPARGLDAAWAGRFLPEPYQPLTNYSGSFLTDWDPADTNNPNPHLKHENLDNEKSHFAVSLSPRSRRMEYGLELTRRLLQQIAALCRRHGTRFSVLYTVFEGDQAGTEAPVVHKVGSRFYIASQAQERANREFINDGFDVLELPVQIKDWRVRPDDAHLNAAANDQVMGLLAARMTQTLQP